MLKQAAVIARLKTAGKGVRGFQEEAVKLTTPLQDENYTGMDSMARVEYVLAIEEEFKVRILDEDFEKMKTFKEVIDYLVKNGK